jgi:hypothetical protein
MLFNLRLFRGRSRKPAEPLEARPGAAESEPPPEPRGFRVMASRVGDTGPAAGDMRVRAPSPIGLAEGEARLRDVFTPTQPRSLGPLFIGREWYLRRLVAAVEEERAHVVLFGDRGRGKTSLANAFSQLTTEAGYVVLSCSCSSSITFEELFRGLLAELPPHMIGSAAPLLPDGKFGAGQLKEALRRLRGGHVILLIDEFDRVQDDTLRIDLAESIKGLSDVAAPVTFLIVGVAQSLDDLLGRHPSIQRNVVGLHLAPMANGEIRRMILAGAAAARIAFAEPVIAAVLRFARGMPYYAHLLCLFAARTAAARGSAEVTMDDLAVAVDDALIKQEAELGESYAQLVAGAPIVEDVLFAASMAAADAHGRFSAEALTGVPVDSAQRVRLRLSVVQQALGALCASGVMQRQDTPDGPRHAFTQPALAHYVLFRQAARHGLLTDAEPPQVAAHG